MEVQTQVECPLVEVEACLAAVDTEVVARQSLEVLADPHNLPGKAAGVEATPEAEAGEAQMMEAFEVAASAVLGSSRLASRRIHQLRLGEDGPCH